MVCPRGALGVRKKNFQKIEAWLTVGETSKGSSK
jgi:hypothetical protein